MTASFNPDVNDEPVTYRVDRNDAITDVSPNWASFARTNEWGSQLPPEKVVGHPVWSFIQDGEVRHLYALLFRKVRAGHQIGPISFRCDSPMERRYLRLLLSPIVDGAIMIRSVTVRTEQRPRIALLDASAPRSGNFVRICSMCKRIAVHPDEWVVTEEGVSRLLLFEAEQIPQLTHGVCPDCYQITMAKLDLLDAPNKTTGGDA
jgi:hypothetical protein